MPEEKFCNWTIEESNFVNYKFHGSFIIDTLLFGWMKFQTKYIAWISKDWERAKGVIYSGFSCLCHLQTQFNFLSRLWKFVIKVYCLILYSYDISPHADLVCGRRITVPRADLLRRIATVHHLYHGQHGTDYHAHWSRLQVLRLLRILRLLRSLPEHLEGGSPSRHSRWLHSASVELHSAEVSCFGRQPPTCLRNHRTILRMGMLWGRLSNLPCRPGRSHGMWKYCVASSTLCYFLMLFVHLWPIKKSFVT